MNERGADVLIRAAAAYATVVADPTAGGPAAAALVAEARRVGSAEALVAALRAEAWYHRTRLDGARAKRLLDEAVRLARREDLTERLGEVLVTRGAVNHELGRPAAAQRDFTAATGLIAPAMAAELAAQQGTLHLNQGRLEEAARLYRRVLAMPGLPRDMRAKVANNLGVVETQYGRPEVALGWLDQAAEAAAGVVPTYAAAIAESRAAATVLAGRLTEGLALFGEAARLWEAAGLPLGELHVELTDALIELRLLPEAREQSRLAVRLLDMQGMPLMAAEAQLRAAQLTLISGDHPAAAAEAAEVAERFRRQRRGSWAARADLVALEARLRSGTGLPGDVAAARRAAAVLHRARTPQAVEAGLVAGRVAAAAGRGAPARAAWTAALTRSRRAPVLVRLRGRVAGALAARLAGDDAAVLRHSRVGLADLAGHRSSLASYELRVLASGQGVELGRLGLGALVRGGTPAQVLDWMERTRAAAVSAVAPAPAPATGMDAELDAELAEMRAAAADLAAMRATGSRAAPDRRQAELEARQNAVEERVRRESWLRSAGAPVVTPRLSLRALRAALGDRVLVEYDVLDGELLAAVVEPARTRLVRLGPVAAVTFEIDALLFALRRLARRTSRPGAALASARYGLDLLARLLLEPLGLPPHPGLVVIPAGPLQRVPWAALHPLPVAVAPAAAMWERGAGALPPRSDVVLVAGPDVPGGAAEVAALAELHPRAVVLQPPDSTAEAVVGALARASLAHLACHGRVRPDNPIFSSLRLADGPLTVHELELRGPAPQRIVLAACESGSEVGYAGNETLGFVSALLARGTAGLVASAIVVPDWDVVPLMRSLHSSVLQGASLAEALFAARATLDRDDPRMFASWCAFNAFGAG